MQLEDKSTTYLKPHEFVAEKVDPKYRSAEDKL
eukprot:COSAG02_NODE_49918_length_324_cov_0.382222_1_plen_32_part_01